MSEEPYLILHKVRGEPAFDIAIKAMIGEEEGWIVSTSGHRAYPWWHERLGMIGRLGWAVYCEDDPLKDCPPMPSDWPDHFACNNQPTESKPSRTASLLEFLGLKKGEIRRA